MAYLISQPPPVEEFMRNNAFCMQEKSSCHETDMSTVCSVILGGGQGSRLFPLTLSRCKPAISFGGKYKLIDVPIANSLNSGINKIFVVTQFLSSSLHPHIFKTYQLSSLSDGFIQVLSAEEKPYRKNWYQGTADAVRENLNYLLESPADYFLILSGDQLYNLNFKNILSFAKAKDADLVVCSLPVDETTASRMGVLKVGQDLQVSHFAEKPGSNEVIDSFAYATPEGNKTLLASMGIYLFKRQALIDLLLGDARNDFGSHLIPTQIAKGRTYSYLYNGYWEDIGTVESYFNANLALTGPNPKFDWYLHKNRLLSREGTLPPPKISHCRLHRSLVCEGAIIDADEIYYSVIGPRTVIHKGAKIHHCYIMGNDYYHPPKHHFSRLPPHLSIGKNTLIEKAIIDKDVSIGNNVKLINKKGLVHMDSECLYVRDGIILVPKGAHIPDNFEF